MIKKYKKIDRRSPEGAAKDVLSTAQISLLDRDRILLRWRHTLDRFSDLVEYTAIKRFERQTCEQVGKLIGEEGLKTILEMGLVPIDRSLYFGLKEAEYEERMRRQQRDNS